VAQAQAYVTQGYRIVVDFDLAKFFDRVNHDRLMAAVAARVSDRRVLRLIRSLPTAGVLHGGLLEASWEGTPQGGPLSPLLSNLVLDNWIASLSAVATASFVTQMAVISTRAAR
jgi:RNA-directed DNA polymerase